jgi:hypothetical protein
MNIENENEMIILEKDMEKYVKKYKYLVVFPDKKVELFKSLRDIQNSICIDSSTISKKLNNNENMFTPKGSNYVFYINQLPLASLPINCPQDEVSKLSISDSS